MQTESMYVGGAWVRAVAGGTREVGNFPLLMAAWKLAPGLAAGVFTRDLAKGLRVLKRLRAGITWLNTYHPTFNDAPWGGYKQSGIGRELGPQGLDAYMETKQINVNLNPARLGWYSGLAPAAPVQPPTTSVGQ